MHYGWVEPFGALLYEMDYFPHAIYVDDLVVFTLYFVLPLYKKIIPQKVEKNKSSDPKKRMGSPFID